MGGGPGGSMSATKYKCMFLVPKDVYQRVLYSSNDRDRREVVNVGQVNNIDGSMLLSSGFSSEAVFPGPAGAKVAPDQDDKKEEEEEGNLFSATAHVPPTGQPIVVSSKKKKKSTPPPPAPGNKKKKKKEEEGSRAAPLSGSNSSSSSKLEAKKKTVPGRKKKGQLPVQQRKKNGQPARAGLVIPTVAIPSQGGTTGGRATVVTLPGARETEPVGATAAPQESTNGSRTEEASQQKQPALSGPHTFSTSIAPTGQQQQQQQPRGKIQFKFTDEDLRRIGRALTSGRRARPGARRKVGPSTRPRPVKSRPRTADDAMSDISDIPPTAVPIPPSEPIPPPSPTPPPPPPRRGIKRSVAGEMSPLAAKKKKRGRVIDLAQARRRLTEKKKRAPSSGKRRPAPPLPSSYAPLTGQYGPHLGPVKRKKDMGKMAVVDALLNKKHIPVVSKKPRTARVPRQQQQQLAKKKRATLSGGKRAAVPPLPAPTAPLTGQFGPHRGPVKRKRDMGNMAGFETLLNKKYLPVASKKTRTGAAPALAPLTGIFGPHIGPVKRKKIMEDIELFLQKKYLPPAGKKSKKK